MNFLAQQNRVIRYWCMMGLLLVLGTVSSSVVANHSNEFLKNTWKDVPAEIRVLIKQQSPVDDVINFTDGTKMLIQTLPFYKGVYIAAVYGGWEPGNLTIYYLITEKGEIERITGRSDLFHRIGKAGRFKFDPAYMDNYLWFRLFFTRSKNHSPFLVLESPEATYFPDLTALESSLVRQIKNNIRPISCQKRNEKTYRCSASVLHEKVIYGVKVDVDQIGGVDMTDDKPLVNKVPYDPRIPLGEWAITGQIKPKKPATKAKSAAPKQKGWSF